MATTSIVDYLKGQGKDASMAGRKALATQYGIDNYTGTADQNLKLLYKLNTPTSGSLQNTLSKPAFTGDPITGQPAPIPPIKSPAAAAPADTGSNPEATPPAPSGATITASLPGGSIDQLTALKLAMRDLSVAAQKQGTKTGLSTVMGGLATSGFAPEKVSGNLVNNIIGFVGDQVNKPIETAFSQMSDMLDGIKTQQAALELKNNQIRDDARTSLQLIYNQLTSNGLNYDSLTPAMKSQIEKMEGVAGLPVGLFSTLQNKSPATVSSLLGGFDSNKPAMRTDRNNNPTAFTTDIAKQAGLVLGRDYEVGDPFQTGNGGTLYTAKLIGDPVDQTIKVLDRIGFYTQSGAQRWTHTAIPKDQWNKMSYEQKSQIVKQMYQKEGGNGSLFQAKGQNLPEGTKAAVTAGQNGIASLLDMSNLPEGLKTAAQSLQQVFNNISSSIKKQDSSQGTDQELQQLNKDLLSIYVGATASQQKFIDSAFTQLSTLPDTQKKAQLKTIIDAFQKPDNYVKIGDKKDLYGNVLGYYFQKKGTLETFLQPAGSAQMVPVSNTDGASGAAPSAGTSDAFYSQLSNLVNAGIQ